MPPSISRSFFARVTRKMREKAYFLSARKCDFYEANTKIFSEWLTALKDYIFFSGKLQERFCTALVEEVVEKLLVAVMQGRVIHEGGGQ